MRRFTGSYSLLTSLLNNQMMCSPFENTAHIYCDAGPKHTSAYSVLVLTAWIVQCTGILKLNWLNKARSISEPLFIVTFCALGRPGVKKIPISLSKNAISKAQLWEQVKSRLARAASSFNEDIRSDSRCQRVMQVGLLWVKKRKKHCIFHIFQQLLQVSHTARELLLLLFRSDSGCLSNRKVTDTGTHLISSLFMQCITQYLSLSAISNNKQFKDVSREAVKAAGYILHATALYRKYKHWVWLFIRPSRVYSVYCAQVLNNQMAHKS